MARPKRSVKGYTMDPGGENAHYSMAVLSALKGSAAGNAEGIAGAAGLDVSKTADYINTCVKSDIINITPSGEIGFNRDFKKVLGVGFTEKEALLTLMDLAGNMHARERVQLPNLSYYKGKVKELKAISEDISAKIGAFGRDIKYVGVAVPDVLIEKNPKAPEILGDGLAHVFNCDAVLAPEATAAGYAEKEFSGKTRGRDLLYLHSDIGLGVILKGESIFESGAGGGKAGYLRSWKQFSIVETAKDLISKGVGTDMVKMLDGDIDGLNLEVVLDAANSRDELAEDLVKRSGLALGVRAAYLVNIFNVDMVVLGGGTEKKEGEFVSFVKESSRRFLLDEMAEKLQIITGELGKEASSMGAASLCRREIFMEV